MLNIYFIFGVPMFLLILYFVFAYIRKKTTIHYLGFILLIISGFMLVFNLQTWQQALQELDQFSAKALSERVGYPIYLIWVPIIIAFFFDHTQPFAGVSPLQLLKKQNIKKRLCVIRQLPNTQGRPIFD